LDYCERWFKDERVPFPYVPVANPVIPENVKEATFHEIDMEIDMSRKGAVLYDPSWDVRCKEPLSVDIIEVGTPVEEVVSKVGQGFLFSARHGAVPSMKDDLFRYIIMDFNPTHPMAVNYIDTISREIVGKDIIYSGRYKWGRKYRPFYFRTLDKRYRIHSDVWMGYYGPKYHYMAPFDMVANFDFYYLLSSKLKGYKRVSMYSALTIEPYSVMGPVHFVYSPMMCARMSQGLIYGMGLSVGVPDTADSIKVPVKKVTGFYRVFEDKLKGHLIVDVRTGKEVYAISKDRDYRYTVNKYTDESLFFEYTVKQGLINVYALQPDDMRDGLDVELKIYVQGGFFLGKPRNHNGSLIDSLDKQSVLDVIKIYEKDPESFLPFALRVPALVEEYEEFKMSNSSVPDDDVRDYGWDDDEDY